VFVHATRGRSRGRETRQTMGSHTRAHLYARSRNEEDERRSPRARAFARRRNAESARSRRARRDEVFATCPIETARVRERASRAYLRDARAAAEGGGLARLDGDGGGERGDGGHGGVDVDACTWSGGARIGDTSAARRSSRAGAGREWICQKSGTKNAVRRNVKKSIKRRCTKDDAQLCSVARWAVPRWLCESRGVSGIREIRASASSRAVTTRGAGWHGVRGACRGRSEKASLLRDGGE